MYSMKFESSVRGSASSRLSSAAEACPSAANTHSPVTEMPPSVADTTLAVADTPPALAEVPLPSAAVAWPSDENHEIRAMEGTSCGIRNETLTVLTPASNATPTSVETSTHDVTHPSNVTRAPVVIPGDSQNVDARTCFEEVFINC